MRRMERQRVMKEKRIPELENDHHRADGGDPRCHRTSSDTGPVHRDESLRRGNDHHTDPGANTP